MNGTARVFALGCVLGLAACASVPKSAIEPNAMAAEGNAPAGYAGAAVGMLASGDDAMSYMQQQDKELTAQLLAAQTNASTPVQVEVASDGTLRISVSADGSFEANSGELRPAMLETYSLIAGVLCQYDKTVIHVVGVSGSDAVGEALPSLSLRRAESAAAYLEAQGVSRARLRHDVAVAVAVQSSKLVLIVRPVIQGQEVRAWMPPLEGFGGK
ncbi:MAG: hypothetical protein ACRESS_05125 [Stenotrophobium sp.]